MTDGRRVFHVSVVMQNLSGNTLKESKFFALGVPALIGVHCSMPGRRPVLPFIPAACMSSLPWEPSVPFMNSVYTPGNKGLASQIPE